MRKSYIKTNLILHTLIHTIIIKIIQDNGILGRHTESFENLNLNWSLFDELVEGIHTNLQERGLSEKKDYSIRHVQFVDIDDDKNGAEAYVDFKKDKESDYSYRMNNEGNAYQYSCSNGNVSLKRNSVRRVSS